MGGKGTEEKKKEEKKEVKRRGGKIREREEKKRKLSRYEGTRVGKRHFVQDVLYLCLFYISIMFIVY